MFKTRFISILALLFGLLPCMSLTAYAASVSYVDGNGTSQTVDATELESTTTSWTDGSWYIVPEGGLTISGRIAVSGTVNLILRDGTELTASAGITTTGATLNIYAQSTGTGALTATGNNGGDPNGGGSAGIGGNGVARTVSGGAGGTVNIYGGTVTATGGNGAQYAGGGAGIGCGGLGYKSSGVQGGTVNIYGGTVTATGGNGTQWAGGGAGIGGGGNGRYASAGADGTVNIYGGTVTATGGTGGAGGGVGAGIGGGGNGYNSSAGAGGTLTLGVGVKLYNGTDNTGTVLDDNDSESRNYSGSRPKNMFAEVTTYNLTLADGTEDAANWQGKAGEGKYQELPLTGLDAGTAVTVKYSGTKKVKSVKAVKKAKPAATVTTAPTAKTGVKAGEDVAIVNEGTAEGGTMMYMVNATQPASTDGFSATVPTAEGLTAGTYYVWYYVKADDSHTDSEISASGIEVTIASAYTMAAAATSADKGKLICTDGHIHANGADAACTKARVAKIIYIGTTGHATYSHGLALALTDEGQMAWEAAKTACNTTKNTSTPVTGATWLLASKDQWDYMMGANGAGSDTALRNGFSGITGASNLQSSWYWSSTEYDADAFYAWDYNFDEEEWDWIEKYENDFVRACLAF